MRKIIYAFLFLSLTSVIFSQTKMTIKKTDNSTLEFQVNDISEMTLTNVGFTCGTSTVTYSGKIYNTVLIGSLCWLKENLDVGSMIQSNSNQWNNAVIEKYCYNNNSSNCSTYGGLYQWAEAVQYFNGATNTTAVFLSGNIQGICPTGWHLPTGLESGFLPVGGNGLKAIGQGTGTNTSGFSALLAGYLDYSLNTFLNLGTSTGFWTTAQNGSSSSYNYHLYSNNNTIAMGSYSKNFGFSVRCVKD